MKVLIPGRPSTSSVVTQALANWRNGKGDILVISGEPGSGKSHVLSQIEELSSTTPKPSIVRVDCTPPIGSFNVASIQPLQPFGHAIEQLYLNGEATAKKRLALNIGMSVLASIPIAGDIFYAVKAISQDVSEYKRETAATQQKKRAAVTECVETLKRIAAETPFVLLVDDGHWSDPQSIEVLERLRNVIRDMPLLIVWTVTPTIAQRSNMPLAAMLRDVPPSSHHVLGALDRPGLDAVVNAIAPTMRLTDQQRDVLFDRSAGTPGIIAEYINYLQRTDQVRSDGTIAAEALEKSGLKLGDHPATDVILHEIGEEDALTLALCAAEGREFTAFMVASLMNTDVITAVRTLRRLQHNTGLIKSVGMRTRYGLKTTAYEFTQSVAFTYFAHYPEYEERKQLHQRIAEILTKEFESSELEELRAQIGTLIGAHSSEAEDTVTATRMFTMYAPSLTETSQTLMSQTEMSQTSERESQTGTSESGTSESGTSEALELLLAGRLSEARALVEEHLAASGLTTSERVQLLCLLARIQAEMGSRSDAEHHLQTAEQLPDLGMQDRHLILNVRGAVAMLVGDHDAAHALLSEAARSVKRMSPSLKLLTMSNVYLLSDTEGETMSERYKRPLRRMLESRSWMKMLSELGLSVVVLMLLCAGAMAQGNIHERHMERAHPTPDLDAVYDFAPPMVPMITAQGSFPSMFLNVNMVTEEQDPLPVQNESSIAVNPRNPKNLIGAAVDYRNNSSRQVYYSTDAGKTWLNQDLGQVRPGWSSSNDPSVAYDHLGRGYLCYGGFNRTGQSQFGENGVFIAYTDDGGLTWPKKHIAVIEHTGPQTADSAFEDKYYVHVDTASTSPFRGRLYIPWKRVINRDSSTGIVIARSTDRGLTWLPPVAVSDRFPKTSEDTTFGQSFPLARTGPDGSVHLVWNSGTESAVRYARSADGGTTWTSPRILHTYEPFGEKSLIAGQVNSRVKEVVRAEAYPSLAIDNTGGPQNGWLHLVWSADNPPNIYYSRSTNNGENWSEARILHSVPDNDQFWPWISIDPTNGDIAVMYFDSRDDANNILVNCYVSYSSDGGTTWIDRRVGDGENDLRRNPFTGNTFAGDYNGCDFYNGMIYPSWVDMRNTTELNRTDNDAFTAIVNVRAPAAPETFTATTIADQPTSIDLAWSAVSTTTFGKPLDMSAARFILRRRGVQIAELGMSMLTYRDSGLTPYERYDYTLTVVTPTDTSADRTAFAYAGGSREPGIPTLLEDPGDGLATITLPTRRLDGTTPLTNLAGVIVTGTTLSGTQEERIDVNAADTGKTINLTFLPDVDGWYHISVRAIDADGNRSPASDTLLAFLGDTDWLEERFDTMPNYHIMSGTWGRTTSFAFSPDGSLTDSPNGTYGPSQRDTIMLYPLTPRVYPEADALLFQARVAAFVDPSDTVFFEYTWDLNGPWNTAAWWNASQNPRWTDTTKSEDAWLQQGMLVPLQNTTEWVLYTRLRFRSNVLRHSDGFYIDDITYQPVTSVAEEKEFVRTIYPQPASHHVSVDLATDAPISSCSLVTLEGAALPATWTQLGRSLTVDVRSLPNGMYVLRVERDHQFSTHRLSVLR